MKQKLKKYLKIGIPLFGILFILNSCLEEDDLKPEQVTKIESQANIQTIKAEDAPDIIAFIQSKSNPNMEFVLHDNSIALQTSRTHEDNLLMTSVLTDQIKQATNSFGKSNYTFKMTKEEGIDGVYFLNLVVKEYKETLYMYFVKYVPELSWFKTYTDESSFSSFTGSMYFYNQEGIYIANVNLVNGASTEVNRVPCDGNNNGDYGDSSGGNDDYTGGGSFPCTWEIGLVEVPCPDGCGDCEACAVVGLIYDCPGINRTMRDDDPCDTGTDYGSGSSGGGGTSADDPCYNAPACNFPEEMYDEFCNCVSAEVIENPLMGVVYEKPPCARLNKLENDEDFKLVLQDLKDKAATDNHETAYILENNDSDLGFNYFGPYEGVENALGINLNFDDEYQFGSFVHNHNNDSQNRNLSILSAKDLYALYAWLDNGHITFPTSFFYFVVTNHGTTYALNISDTNAFIAFGDIMFAGWDTVDKEDDVPYLNQEYEGSVGTQTYPLGIKNGNTVAENEQNFMKLMEYPGINVGLDLFKADENFENWKKVKLNNNGQVDYDDPCN